MRKPFGMAAAILLFAGCSGLEQPTAVLDAPVSAAIAEGVAGQAIAGRYIVVFKKDVGDVAGLTGALARAHGASVVHQYQHAIKGFAAAMSAQAAARLATNPSVLFIEQDQVATLGPSIQAKPGPQPPPSQSTPWGITRIGGAGDGTASGVGTAWIIDTGIDLNHPDLNVDAARSRSFLSFGPGRLSAEDGHGHGTHVAGTIAARNNAIGVVGVAAGAKVAAVRVLNSQGSGSYSDIIAGVDYVGANGQAGDVANMSLGGGVSAALNNAVIAASANVKFALAAGNESTNAATRSPASANGPNIYTVSAMSQGDVWASFSNFGNPPIDWCAPGVSVLSTWKGDSYNTISGTSMATPHVAGILLLGAIHASGNVTGDPDGNADPIAHR